MSQVTPFTCTNCGKCCEDLTRGPWDGVALQCWEVEPIQKLAQARKITVNVVPLLGNFSCSLGLFYSFFFLMEAARCPFHDRQQGCLIYQQRPLACRQYPLQLSGGFTPLVKSDRQCPAAPDFDAAASLQPGKQCFQFLSHVYGTTYFDSVKAELCQNFVIQIHELIAYHDQRHKKYKVPPPAARARYANLNLLEFLPRFERSLGGNVFIVPPLALIQRILAMTDEEFMRNADSNGNYLNNEIVDALVQEHSAALRPPPAAPAPQKTEVRRSSAETWGKHDQHRKNIQGEAAPEVENDAWNV